MEVVEVQQVAVRAPDVAAVAAVQADAADLDRVGGDSDGVEYRLWVQRVQAVGDVQVVADIGRRIVCITNPRLPVDVGLIQFTRILTPKIGNRNPSRITCINLREYSRDNCARTDSDTGLFPCLSRISTSRHVDAFVCPCPDVICIGFSVGRNLRILARIGCPYIFTHGSIKPSQTIVMRNDDSWRSYSRRDVYSAIRCRSDGPMQSTVRGGQSKD